MKFKKIILNNFFRYYDKQEIILDTNDEKTVVAIIGENGRGKTTILSAFNYVMYNKLLEPLTVDNMLNKKKMNELQIGEKATAYVELHFEEKDISYCIKRCERFSKNSENELIRYNEKENGVLYEFDGNGSAKELEVKRFEDKLLIPEKLSGFFFFDGERINRLAKVDGKKEIQEAILNVLGISYLELMKKDIQLLKRRSRTELSNHTNDESYEEILKKINRLDDKKDEINKKIEVQNSEVQKTEEKIEELANELRNSNDVETKELENRSSNLKEQIEINKNNLVKKEKEIKKYIGENFKYYLAKKFIKKTNKILEEKKEAGVLPADIKDTFIDNLLEKKRCICGTCIEENSEEWDELIKAREMAGSENLNKAYYDLKSSINRIEKTSENFYEILDKLIKEREDLREMVYFNNEEIQGISKKLENSNIETIVELEKTRKQLEEYRANIYKKIGGLEIEQDDVDNQLKSNNKQAATLKSNDKKVNYLQRKINTMEKISQLNEDFKIKFTELVRKELDLKIKEVFGKLTNKEYRYPILTENFELKIISTLGEKNNLEDKDRKDEVLSTGEGQITSLAFIGALVDYARENKNDELLSALSGDQYPIVMDSPFGNLDEAHTKNVAANIGKLAPQVIIVVSKKQWKGYVEENILNQLNMKYHIKDGEIENGAEWSFIEREEI